VRVQWGTLTYYAEKREISIEEFSPQENSLTAEMR
jgi:hypothetical protein